ncbi:hypothetical protein [Apilactobacillus xinyiensis]|uniref:hypothetical protein n=1 Tax=Apilactobacillus xinyiensis TaxID=2841032 RepID=UPI00200C56C9|nr:hypothetical protein [Apilactobacillus xinyiensis]MCL0330583.1 hypothetical protein [Apilactobacillus xinyiensis]
MLQTIITSVICVLAVVLLIAYIKNIVVEAVQECILYKYQMQLSLIKEIRNLDENKGENKNE